MVKRSLCAETGLLEGAYCNIAVSRNTPTEMRAMKACHYHQRLHLNKTKEHQVCSLCWNINDVQTEIQLIYPPDVRSILVKNGNILSKIPGHNPAHPGYHYDNVMNWIYPQPNTKIWIPRGMSGKHQRVSCKIAHLSPKSNLFWYLNDQYIGKTQTYHELAILFKNGKNRLLVIDEDGNRIEQIFTAAIK